MNLSQRGHYYLSLTTSELHIDIVLQILYNIVGWLPTSDLIKKGTNQGVNPDLLEFLISFVSTKSTES
jgi:hypothetical protein